MSGLARRDILNLGIAERVELVGDIWDGIAEVPEAVSPVSLEEELSDV